MIAFQEVCKPVEEWLETLCSEAVESMEGVVPYKAGTVLNGEEYLDVLTIPLQP